MRRRRQEPRDEKAVERAGARLEFAFSYFALQQIAQRLETAGGFRGNEQQGRDGARSRAAGAPVERRAGMGEPHGFGEDEPSFAPDAPAVAEGGVYAGLTMRDWPNTALSTIISEASAATSASSRRRRSAPSNRIVSCGAQTSEARLRRR